MPSVSAWNTALTLSPSETVTVGVAMAPAAVIVATAPPSTPLAPVIVAAAPPSTPLAPVIVAAAPPSTPSAPVTDSNTPTSALTVNVNSIASLTSALKTAQAGETIALAPGTYSNLVINNLNFANTVTITSQNAADPAVLTSFSVVGSNDLKFENLVYSTAGATNPIAFRIVTSSNIQLNQINLHGSLDNNPNDDVSGLQISGSSNVSVTNSQFSQLYGGIGQINNTNLIISGNSFHDIENDAIDGGGSSYVTISGNSFTNLTPLGTNAHPDAIQFWTSNTTASQTNITITDNVITEGTGEGSLVHGIFMGNELNIPYQNVTISGNIITGLSYNGITVGDAINLNVSNNIVASYSDVTPSWIKIINSTNVTMNSNVLSASGDYVLTGDMNLTQIGDIATAPISPNGTTKLSSLLMSNSPLGASAISHTTSLTAALLQMPR